MKKQQPKKKKQQKVKEAVPPIPQRAAHQRDFDQLLDDAIFGVKKPLKRG